MRRPAHRDAAFGPTQSIGYAPLATRQDERHRAGPMSRRNAGRRSREVQAQARDHFAAGDEQKERLRARSPLEVDQSLDGVEVHRAAESVHGFRRVGEHTTRLKVSDRRPDRRFDFFGRPEWNGDRCVRGLIRASRTGLRREGSPLRP